MANKNQRLKGQVLEGIGIDPPDLFATGEYRQDTMPQMQGPSSELLNLVQEYIEQQNKHTDQESDQDSATSSDSVAVSGIAQKELQPLHPEIQFTNQQYSSPFISSTSRKTTTPSTFSGTRKKTRKRTKFQDEPLGKSEPSLTLKPMKSILKRRLSSFESDKRSPNDFDTIDLVPSIEPDSPMYEIRDNSPSQRSIPSRTETDINNQEVQGISSFKTVVKRSKELERASPERTPRLPGDGSSSDQGNFKRKSSRLGFLFNWKRTKSRSEQIDDVDRIFNITKHLLHQTIEKQIEKYDIIKQSKMAYINEIDQILNTAQLDVQNVADQIKHQR